MPLLGLTPQVVVLVATVRALKMHGGGPKVVAGKPLTCGIHGRRPRTLRKGLPNMIQHIENALKFGVNVVVAVNSFANDTDAEVELVRQAALEAGAMDAVVSRHWMEGGKGASGSGGSRGQGGRKPSNFPFLYPLDQPIKTKIETICREVYRSDGVDYSRRRKPRSSSLPSSASPICRCAWQRHLSFSTEAALKGAPRRRVLIRDIRASVGAGFLSAARRDANDARPPTRPVFYDVDLDLATGKVVGLF